MSDMTQVPEDAGADYMKQRQMRGQATDRAEMEAFVSSMRAGTVPQPGPVTEGDPARRMPPAPPLRRSTDDPIGRIPVEPPKAGESAGVMRNIAEMPGAAIKGVESALSNSIGWAIDPLANWLNDNVMDTRYQREAPKTGMGTFTKDVTEFLTGFVPVLKGFRAAGLTGKVLPPMMAGAVADFAARDPSAGRLADLWKKMELPQNILTDFLASKPDDTQMASRFKNALEGVGLGLGVEGVFLAANLIRNARAVKGAKSTETAYLRDKYGEISDAEFNKIIGDPSKPSVEMVVHEPPVAGAKIVQGAEDTANLAPRSVIRTPGGKPKTAPAELSITPQDGGYVLKDAHGDLIIGPTADKEEFRARYNDLLSKGDGGRVNKKQFDALLQPKTIGPESKDYSVYVNFAKFDEPDQVKFVIGKMAEAAKGTIDEATRGVIAHAETQKLAENLGMTVTELLARRKGQGFNAEEAVAARQLWAASAERLLATAKTAAGKNAGALDQYAFRQQMAVHAAIQSEVLGARTETARALNAWKIPVKGDIERARAIDQVVNAMGGPDASKEMARRLAILAETNADPAAIAKFAQQGAVANTVDAVKEAWINGLLANPKTHVVNTTSNTLVAAAAIAERQIAAGIRTMSGGEGVHPMEAAAMFYGMVSGMKDAWRMAAKAVKTGETSWTFNKMDLPQAHAISSEAFNMANDTAAGRFVDFLGTATRVPTRLLGAEDEFFKTIGYRMELHAQAVRNAAGEGLTGEAFGRRVAQLVENPPEHIMINSADAALYQTFTNEVGSVGRSIMNFRNNVPASIFVLPFVRTPVNIARYAFERSPFAPLVGQWRADIAAGGPRADMALARMSTGTMIMMQAMDMADKGQISGAGFRGKDTPEFEALQRQGWQPYSFKVGDRWHSYNRLDPFGMTLGFAASIAEAVKKGEIDQNEVDEWHEVTAMSIAAVSQVVVNKTYLEGFANFVELMTDPRRRSQKYVDDLVASFLPATSAMSAVKNFVDPVSREVSTPAEAVMARIAGLSESLPPRRDLWGKELNTASGLGSVYDMFSPIGSKAEKPEPIDREMVRMGHGTQRIGKLTTVDGVQANFRFYPKAYDDYVRLAGNDLKSPAHGGMGAKDYLNAVVDGSHPMSAIYTMLPDEGRKAFIQNTIQQFRHQAAQQMLNDPKHAGFAGEVAKLKEYHRDGRIPMVQ